MLLILKADLTEERVGEIVIAAEEHGLVVERLKDSSPPCVQVSGCEIEDLEFARKLDGVEEVVRLADLEAEPAAGRLYFPHFALQALIGGLVLVMALVALSAFFPRPPGAPLDLIHPPSHVSPEWYALSTHFLLAQLPAWLVFGATLCGWLLLLALPRIDRKLELSRRGHLLVLVLLLGGAGLIVLFSLLGRAL